MKNQGGSSQDRRRSRRAAAREALAPLVVQIPADELEEIRHLAASAITLEPRELAPGEILEEGELGQNATATLVAPEDAALERLEAELTPTAFVRFVFPQDVVDEAASFLAGHARIANDSEVSGDLAAALKAKLGARVDEELGAMFSRAAGTSPNGITTMRFELAEFDVTLPVEMQPGETLPAPSSSASPELPTLANGPAEWTAVFVPEATLTDDGRAFAPDALTWRELPLTLMGMNETGPGGHEGAVACGRIDRVWRDGYLIRAAGVFSEDEVGTYFATNVGDGTIRGLSVDIAIHEYEVGPRGDYFDEDGNWRRAEQAAEEPTLEDVLFGGEVEDPIFVVTKAVIGMATVCPFPAFAGANISLLASGAIWSYTHQGGFTVVMGKPIPALTAAAETPACADCSHAYATHDGDGGACSASECSCGSYAEPDSDDEMGAEGDALTAAAAGLAPLNPPLEWFQNPEFEELTPLVVDADGRIYGHAWSWGLCHTGIPVVCTTAPRSMTNYSYFHTGELECEDGSRVPVGRITFDTGHAGQKLSRLAAVAHYDDTGKVGAYVVVGEDEFGGWVAGTIAAAVSAEDAQKLRGAAPSGDWRAVNGNLELIALLSVNVAGFPVPRPRALVASSGDDEHLEVLSLTAAGVYEMLRERTPEDDFREIEALAAQARGDFGDLAAAARG